MRIYKFQLFKMTNKELIETARQAMEDLWEINQGRLLEHEQTAYNCLRLFCERLEASEDLNEQKRKEFCLWYYAEAQPLDANKVFYWFISHSA